MRQYKIHTSKMITGSTLHLALRLENDEQPLAFLPGQYAGVSYQIGKRWSAVRCFSIASSPTDPDTVEFGVRVGGRFTKKLSSLPAGTKIRLYGPYGHFVFDGMRHPHMLLCSGGIGITPFLSMVRFATETQQPNRITLVMSVRSQGEAPFLHELKRLQASNSNLHLVYVVGDGPTGDLAGLTVFQGRITVDILRGLIRDGNGATSYICGPPPFMQAVTNMLQESGLANDHILTEAFSQNGKRQVSRINSWQSNIYALGAVGTAASFVMVMASDIMRTLPSTLLPETLSSSAAKSSINSRQQDLDTLVGQLAQQTTTTYESPGLTNAIQAVAQVEAQIDEVNAKNAAITGSAPKNQPASKPKVAVVVPPKQSAPAPAPQPVCTTSASGVTTCQ